MIFLNFQQISGSINPALMIQKASSVKWPLPVNHANHAERGIALIESFSDQFTKDEEQLQFASQVVANHGKKFSEFSNQTLPNNFELCNRQQLFCSILLMNKKNLGQWTLNSSWRTVVWYWYLRKKKLYQPLWQYQIINCFQFVLYCKAANLLTQIHISPYLFSFTQKIIFVANYQVLSTDTLRQLEQLQIYRQH